MKLMGRCGRSPGRARATPPANRSMPFIDGASISSTAPMICAPAEAAASHAACRAIRLARECAKSLNGVFLTAAERYAFTTARSKASASGLLVGRRVKPSMTLYEIIIERNELIMRPPMSLRRHVAA